MTAIQRYALMAGVLVAMTGNPAISLAGNETVRVDVRALYLNREDPGAAPLVSSFAGLGTGDMFNAADIDPGWKPGMDLRVNLALDEKWGFEFGALVVMPYTAASNSPGPVIEGRTPFLLLGTTNVRARWRSSLSGFELGENYDLVEGLELFGGVRFIELDESLDLTMRSAATAITYRIDTSNSMVGPQLGARVDVGDVIGGGLDPFSMRFEVAAGALFNYIDSSATSAPVISSTSSVRDNEVSLALRGGIEAGFEIASGVDLALGYQALWIDNVALVTEQLAVTDVFTPGLSTTTTDQILFHGGHATLTFALN